MQPVLLIWDLWATVSWDSSTFAWITESDDSHNEANPPNRSQFFAQAPVALPLVLLVKRWAKIEGLNKAFEGNLSLGRPQCNALDHYEYSTIARKTDPSHIFGSGSFLWKDWSKVHGITVVTKIQSPQARPKKRMTVLAIYAKWRGESELMPRSPLAWTLLCILVAWLFQSEMMSWESWTPGKCHGISVLEAYSSWFTRVCYHEMPWQHLQGHQLLGGPRMRSQSLKFEILESWEWLNF